MDVKDTQKKQNENDGSRGQDDDENRHDRDCPFFCLFGKTALSLNPFSLQLFSLQLFSLQLFSLQLFSLQLFPRNLFSWNLDSLHPFWNLFPDCLYPLPYPVLFFRKPLKSLILRLPISAVSSFFQASSSAPDVSWPYPQVHGAFRQRPLPQKDPIPAPLFP